MAPAPDVSVVVVTLDALPWVERCLESVRGHEVIVVDHGSTDGTLAFVRERFPEVRVVEQENRGMGAGNNAGMRLAAGRYAFLLNSDAWVVGDGLERLVAFADAHPEAAVLGPRLRNTDGTLQRSVRAEPTVWRLATEYAGVRKLAPRSTLLNPLYVGGFDHRTVREADWLYGAALLVRRAAAEEVGLFDEAFFMFGEEVDWLTRFRRAGWRVLFYPEAEVVHVGGASHGGRLYAENLRGHLRFLDKHRGRVEAERARRVLLWSLRLRGLAFRGARGATYRAGARFLASGDVEDPDRMIEYLRLALGTVVVLAPGAAVAGALHRRSAASLLAWATASLFVAWAVVFTVHGSIRLAAALLGAIFAAAVAVSLVRGRRRRTSARERTFRAGWPWLLGLVLGWFLWSAAGAVVGDGLFHEARVRKLVDLGDLHLRTVDEFRDGGLHPGYAFPLWHGFLALVSWVAGVDPGEVVRHEPSLLAPLACALAWEAGATVFRSRWAGASVLFATLAMFVFGPGHGGSYASLAQPATAARQLYVPAVFAVFFAAASGRARIELAVLFGALALVHPTYALFVLIPLAGYAVLQPRTWREWAPALAAAVVPVGLALLWLKPIVDETVSHDPSAVERARAIKQYADQLVVANAHHYRIAPELLGRSGAVAVAALLLLPVTALAWPRRWVAFVLGGTLLVLVLLEVPWLFVHLSDAVSLSQSRRAAGFAPLPFALAGAFALLARSALVLPFAFAGGVVLQRLWPGDFAYGLRHGGPALATWIALFGGAAALAAALVLRRSPLREHHRLGAAAMLCFVVPVVVHGVRHWSPRSPTDPGALSPRLVDALRTRVPERAIVLAPLQVSYRVVADAPLYVVGLPVAHVANTRANDPRGRARAVAR